MRKVSIRVFLDRQRVCVTRFLNLYRVSRRRADDVIKVVFIVNYPPGWNKIELLYSAMQLEPKLDVFLLIVPNENEALIEETNSFFKDKGGKRAILAKGEQGEWFDLEALEPDYVFYQRPYNDYYPEIYRSNVVYSYSKTAYIPYGYNIDAPRLSSGEYAPMYEISNNKDFFNNLYLFFASNIEEAEVNKKRYILTHALSMQKTIFLGYPAFAKMWEVRKNKMGCFFQKFAEHRNKINVMYTPRWTANEEVGGGSSSNLFRDKILLYARENRDKINLIIRPHPLMFREFLEKQLIEEEELNRWKEKVSNLDNVYLDMSADYQATFWETDVLLSDYSSVVVEFFLTGKPLIYWRNCDLEYSHDMQEILNCSYCIKNWDEAKSVLDKLIVGKDEMREKRHDLHKKMTDGLEEVPDEMIRFLEKDAWKK